MAGLLYVRLSSLTLTVSGWKACRSSLLAPLGQRICKKFCWLPHRGYLTAVEEMGTIADYCDAD
jgi:hypothetical protein